MKPSVNYWFKPYVCSYEVAPNEEGESDDDDDDEESEDVSTFFHSFEYWFLKKNFSHDFIGYFFKCGKTKPFCIQWQ